MKRAAVTPLSAAKHYLNAEKYLQEARFSDSSASIQAYAALAQAELDCACFLVDFPEFSMRNGVDVK